MPLFRHTQLRHSWLLYIPHIPKIPNSSNLICPWKQKRWYLTISQHPNTISREHVLIFAEDHNGTFPVFGSDGFYFWGRELREDHGEMTMVKSAPILGIWGPYGILYGEIYPLSWPEPHFQAIWIEIVHPMWGHSSINNLSWRRFTMEISMYRTVWSASGAIFQGEGWMVLVTTTLICQVLVLPTETTCQEWS